jgi:hypothetical protein
VDTAAEDTPEHLTLQGPLLGAALHPCCPRGHDLTAPFATFLLECPLGQATKLTLR